MNKNLAKTLIKWGGEISHGTYVDTYNKIINKNIAGAITTRNVVNGNSFVAIEVKKRSGGGLPIKNATKQGYLIAYEGDGIDISNRMVYHRGTVQHGLSQTITTQINVGVLVKDER